MSESDLTDVLTRTCCAAPAHRPHDALCGLEEYEQARRATRFNEETGLVHCGHCGGEHPGGSPLLPVWPTNHQHEAWLRDAHARTRRANEEAHRALAQVGFLMGQCRRLLQGRRPQWWREAVRWWNNDEWSER